MFWRPLEDMEYSKGCARPHRVFGTKTFRTQDPRWLCPFLLMHVAPHLSSSLCISTCSLFYDFSVSLARHGPSSSCILRRGVTYMHLCAPIPRSWEGNTDQFHWGHMFPFGPVSCGHWWRCIRSINSLGKRVDGSATLENSLAGSQRVKQGLTMWPSNSAHVFTKENETCVHIQLAQECY